MPACFALRKNSLLVIFRQSDVAVAPTVDMHEHRAPNKKGIFVYSRIRFFRNTRQTENPVP
jgi:hypothetical protein